MFQSMLRAVRYIAHTMTLLNVICRHMSTEHSTIHHTGRKTKLHVPFGCKEAAQRLYCLLSSLQLQELIQWWKHKTQEELSIEPSCQDTLKRPGPQKNQLFRHQEKWKCTYGFPPNQQNLRTPACKLYQLLLAQLKSSPPPRSNPQRLLLPLADKVEGNGCYSSATVVNHNKVI